MIDRTHDVAISQQAGLLGLSRPSVYYPPRAVAEADLVLMRQLDALHLELPLRGQSHAARLAPQRRSHNRA